MELISWALLVLSIFRSSHANNPMKNRAKIVEDYILSAKFDDRFNLPQITNTYDHTSGDYLKPNERNEVLYPGTDDTFDTLPMTSYRIREETLDDNSYKMHPSKLSERDLNVHHHHLGMPLPGPSIPHPPPLPPLVVGYGSAFLAVGLITFLMLLNALQTSLFLMTKPKPLLGALPNPLGRRKRFAVPNKSLRINSTEVFLRNNSFFIDENILKYPKRNNSKGGK